MYNKMISTPGSILLIECKQKKSMALKSFSFKFDSLSFSTFPMLLTKNEFGANFDSSNFPDKLYLKTQEKLHDNQTKNIETFSDFSN